MRLIDKASVPIIVIAEGMVYLAARGGDGLGKLSRVLLALTAGHILVFGYQLATGMLNFAQAGPPLIINAIFTVLLFLFRKD